MEFTKMAMTCIFMTILAIDGILSAHPKGSHTRLVEELLKDYGPIFSRPVKEFNQTILVEFHMYVSQIIQLNERDQTLKISANVQMRWRDEYLMWNTSKYPDVTMLNIPASSIWRPDIHLFGNTDKDFKFSKDGLTVVLPNGYVLWITPSILTTSCYIDARFFPFDTQRCRLKFASWVYDRNQMDLVLNSLTDNHIYYVPNGIWDLTRAHSECLLTEYDDFEDFYYPEIVFTLELTRMPLYYVLTVIAPCFMLSLVNLMVFVLPTESGEKVSFGITNVLALVLFQQLIGETIPPVSDKSPIISRYYFTPMIIIGCLSVISGVAVSYLHHQKTTSEVPTWIAKLLRTCKITKALQDSSENQTNPMISETDTSNLTTVKKSKSDKYVSNNATNGIDMTDDYFMIDDSKERRSWDEVAALLDRVMMIVCLCLTMLSVITTAILFLVL